MRRRSCNLAAHHRLSAASLLQQLKPLIFSSLSNSLSTLSTHHYHFFKMGPGGNNLLVLDLINQGLMEPDARLYADLLKRCTDQGKLRLGKMVYTHFNGTQVFDEMIERDMVSYTMLVTGYSHHNEFKEALCLSLDMLRIGLWPNEFTFSSALKSAGGLQSYVIGGGIHRSCLRSGFGENLYVGSALVDMYTRCKRMADAKLVFNGLRGTPCSVLVLRDEKGWVWADPFHILEHFRSQAAGLWRTELVAFVGNTLLDMYGKAGSIKDAKRVFGRLVKKDVISWNSMLTAYAQHGFGEKAVSLFEEMRGAGFQPNTITFICVLTACSHAGLVDKGLDYFNLMRKYEREPDITLCVSAIDLLGRAGQLDRALCFIQEMRVKPTAAVWKALLGAYRMYKNTNLGTYAVEQVFKLDPLDSGPHVLLSNIYASTGQLTDAARVRKAMDRCGVKKEPACSWVEIGGAVHVFLANDDTNPEREEI
ncbi:pentatricopeptide repeat-containing protein [Striga asiatica]|uniref:Pentatricopeptide repeat-containing protein n=1 Tax=Striga asiatica TaxID=4170 RepID=A0A5A7QC17_STRAF|nr:pentatricopeptide repeat-containing protein [Striga asiatica]